MFHFTVLKDFFHLFYTLLVTLNSHYHSFVIHKVEIATFEEHKIVVGLVFEASSIEIDWDWVDKTVASLGCLVDIIEF